MPGDDKIVAGGHDAMPAYFAYEGEAWGYKGMVAKPSAAEAAKKSGGGGVAAARNMWANKADLGAADAKKGGKLDSLHQNSISGLIVMDDARFSTCGPQPPRLSALAGFETCDFSSRAAIFELGGLGHFLIMKKLKGFWWGDCRI